MNRRTHRHVVKLLAGATCAALLAPSGALAASAASGGAGISGGSGTTGTTGTTGNTAAGSSPTGTTTGAATTTGARNPLVQPGDQPVSASGNGITLRTTAAGLYGRALSFTGTAPSTDAGYVAEIKRKAPGAGSWLPTAHATVAGNGSFSVSWRAVRTGHLEFQAVLTPTQAQAAGAGDASGQASTTTSSPAVPVTVYATSRATIYGPGFYGNRTACGQRLLTSTVGVASRTLRCGARVTLYYDKRILTVPVIDRGPYGNGASWDLTMATARALGISGTETIGTARPLSAAQPPLG